MDIAGFFGVTLIMILIMAFMIWFVFILPANMARCRNRSALVWVLISIFGSPFLAVLLLIALGYSKDDQTGR
jgi:hypothetical protein